MRPVPGQFIATVERTDHRQGHAMYISGYMHYRTRWDIGLQFQAAKEWTAAPRWAAGWTSFPHSVAMNKVKHRPRPTVRVLFNTAPDAGPFDKNSAPCSSAHALLHRHDVARCGDHGKQLGDNRTLPRH